MDDVAKRLTPYMVALLATAWVALLEIERLLGLVGEPSGDNPYPKGFDVTSLTTPHLWNSESVNNAFKVLEGDSRAAGWVILYLVADLFFLVALAALLFAVLRRAHVGDRRARLLAGLYLVFDGAETVLPLVPWLGFCSGGAVPSCEVPSVWFTWLVTLASLLKWAVLILSAVVLVLTLVRNRALPEAVTLTRDRALAGSGQPAELANTGLIVVVGAFVLLVALPGGSALTQLPDVIRALIEEASGPRIALAIGSIVLLATAVMAASLAMSSRRQTSRYIERKALRWWYPAGAGAIIAAAVWIVLGSNGWTFSPWAVLAWVLIPLAVIVFGFVARVIAPLPDDDALTCALSPHFGEPRGPRTADGDTPLPSPESPARRSTIAVWLAAAVVAGAGIGLLRGALPAYLLDVGDEPYGVYVLVAIAVAVLVPGLLAAFGPPLLERGLKARWHRRRTVAGAAVGVLVLGLAGVLAVAPERAPVIGGSAGVIALGFAAGAVVVGGASWLSKRCPTWEASRHLWLGSRPSVGLLLVGVWLLSSVLGGPDGYYDARVLAAGTSNGETSSGTPEGGDAPGATSPGSGSDLTKHVTDWIEAATASACGRDETVSVGGQSQNVSMVPLVFVVAPGGGIRAAYWTASGMDEFFSDPDCAVSLFAFSGVSGGSVGGTIRLLTPPVANSRPHVVAMARDEALARNLAGLFFRDIPQPFLPAKDGWEDRAELMERAWIDAAPPVLAPVVGENAQEPTMESVGASWRDGQGAPPAVLLNASSVLDGCVAVSATWTGLAAGSASSCFAVRDDGGPLASTHETRRLVDGGPGGKATPSRIPAITGALLSARFPFVSPSGAVRSEQSDDVLYLIDGGVYENTGLLSALSLWNAVEPVVAAHNEAQGDGGTVVEPWLLMLSSGYEREPRGRSTSRPSEILAVVQAFFKRTSSGVAGEEALRQRAAAAFSGPLPGLAGVGGGVGAGGSGAASGSQRFVEVRPRADDPSVIAPLGWVLAPSTQTELTSELDLALTGSGARALAGRLGAKAVEPGS